MSTKLAALQDIGRGFGVLVANVARFDGTSRRPQVGRALIALGELLTLGLTNWTNLTADVLGRTPQLYCAGARGISLFCLGGDKPNEIGRWLGIAIAMVVISGLVPRYTSVLHAWLAVSMSISLSLPDGGESVAVFATLLLVPILVPNDRLNGWSAAPRAQSPTLNGIGYAGSLALCVQLAGIYYESGLSKIAVNDWANGSAMFYVTRDPMFGTSGILGGLAQGFTALPIGTAALTWGTIALECTIATLFLAPAHYKRYGLVAVVVLHAGIAVLMGLWSFSLVMIGTAAVAAYDLRPRPSNSLGDGASSGHDDARSKNTVERTRP